MPHTIVGVALLGHLAITLLVAVLGTDLTGTVTRTHTTQGSKGGTNYHVDYVYTADGRKYKSSGTVRPGTYAALSRPQTAEATGPLPSVRIRFLQAGPVHYHLLTQERSAWTEAAQALGIALFWNGILSAFIVLLWVVPIRARLLVRHGDVTIGTILKSRVSVGKSTTYYATFHFRNLESGEEIQKEVAVPKALYNDAIQGRVITVIYDPRKPRRALAYELSGFKVEGAAGQD